ncbi:DUF445 family protein [Exiguobacterium sp. RIT341]|uniref:DUF445 family protein n=1 Tax=Exiguobacterium sp. RIT341 TaxID=1470592 RepID=UPI00044F41A8|nr:DUF445 family protein [Exiguobacterium sp. RIT341]EZP62094.1 Membrane protein [Exiguobacterium sp. RIT341]
MSDTLLLVLKLVGIVIIGALIGAITNHLAIRMLFRPLEPKYIGKFRVPFTPGLIPKRRNELAANLGRTVVKHLLTPEGIGKRLASPAVRGAVTRLVEQEVMKWTRSEETTEAWISRFIDEPKQRIQGKISYQLEQEFSRLMNKWREQSVRNLIGASGEQKIEEVMPRLVTSVLHQAEVYFDGPEGRLQLEETVARFIQQRLGGGMFGMLLANVNIVDMIQPELKRVLQSESTSQFILALLRQEWQKGLDCPLSSYMTEETESRIRQTVKEQIMARLPIESMLATPLRVWLNPLESQLLEQHVPVVIDHLFERTTNQIGQILQTLDLETIVREEVDLLDTAYLEEIVLSISKREFRAITWLGGLLGGLIGLIQAGLYLV